MSLPIHLVTNKGRHAPYPLEVIPADVELVTSVSAESTDQQVPTAKAVHDSVASATPSTGVMGMVIFTASDVAQGGGATVLFANGMFEEVNGASDFAVTATSVLVLFPEDQPDVNYNAIATDKNGTVKSPIIGGGNITVGQVKVDGLTIADGDQLTLFIVR